MELVSPLSLTHVRWNVKAGLTMTMTKTLKEVHPTIVSGLALQA